METIATFNRENIPEEIIKGFRHRRAVRGVIVDKENNVALLHAVVEGYYGLPGGGVQEDEDFTQGILRECKEEIGCTVEILHELGTTIEYREKYTLINESHGYMGKVIGEKGEPILLGDEDEAERNAVVVWVPISEAIHLMKNTPIQDNLYGQYCLERDIAFLVKSLNYF